PDRVLACELAWEVHARGYWSQLRRSNGSPYETEEAYFREVLGLASWRTAYKRLAIGRMLWSFGEAERAAIRTAIVTVGLAKASIVTPAIERLGEWRGCLADWEVALAQKMLMRVPLATCHRSPESEAEADPTSIRPEVICRHGQTA